MRNQTNLHTYRLWAPIYDLLFNPLFSESRRRAIAWLDLQVGERLLIPGVGTGLDLPYILLGVTIIGTDLSPAMLTKARSKANIGQKRLLVMDAQNLGFLDASFEAVLLNLILSVVPDGSLAFREAWRTLKPGGRAVIFDKFLPEGSTVTLGRRWLGRLISALGTDPNRRLSEIIGGTPDLVVQRDEPGLLRGHYRLLLLQKSKDV